METVSSDRSYFLKTLLRDPLSHCSGGWREKVGRLAEIAFKLQMIVANCMLKESVLQKSHPNTSLNFQSDAIGKKIQEDNPRGH